MYSVGATEFVRRYAEWKLKAQREPVAVQSHGRTEGYFISAEEFERYQDFLEQSTKAYHPSELPAHLKEALSTTRMDPRHDHLNSLMD